MFKKLVVTAILAASIGALAYYFYPSTEDSPLPTMNVVSKYENALRNTCGIVPKKAVHWEQGGTGVLLNTGFVLTAKHNVDRNNNGKIDKEERAVKLKFYYPEEIIMDGVVVHMVEGKFTEDTIDAAVIAPEWMVADGVELVSVTRFQDIDVGTKIFTIGRTIGDMPTISDGITTPKPLEWYGFKCRATLPVYHGNSGGGVFTEDGELIGVIVTIKKGFTGYPVPNWTGYSGATDIRIAFLVEGAHWYLGNPRSLLKRYGADAVLFLLWLALGVFIAREIIRN